MAYGNLATILRFIVIKVLLKTLTEKFERHTFLFWKKHYNKTSQPS